MKKFTLSLLSLLLATCSFAQIYIRASVGYNLPAASDQLGTSEKSRYNITDGYSTTREGVYGSYGSGLAAHFAFGGGFKGGMFGYDLDFGYVKGKTYDVTDSYDNGSTVSSTVVSCDASSIQISPALTFTTGTGSFQPFARVGPTFGITSMMEKQHSHESYYNYTTDVEYEYSGGINVGLKGVLGCSYQLNDKLQLYVEADFVSLAYAPKKRTMTRNEQNGTDNLPQTDPNVVNVEYEKEQTTTTEYGVPQIRPTFPMSSIGFSGGIKFIF